MREQLSKALGEQLERFALLLDAGVEVDVEPLRADLPSLEARLTSWAAVSGAAQFVSSACLAAQPEAWHCLAGEHALPYVRSDIIARAPLYDRAQLAAAGLLQPPADPLEEAFAAALRAATALALVRAVAERAGSGALMAACWSADEGAAGDGWRKEMVSNLSMEAAADAWFFARNSSDLLPQIVQDNCDAFACGTGC